MPHLSPAQKDLVRRECEGLAGREKTQKVHELATMLNTHPSTIYRALPGSTRQPRADRGLFKCPVSHEILEQMFALSAKDWSSPEVIETAELNHWIQPGAISVPTYNRLLASRQLSHQQRKQYIKPFRWFEESFANERHYLDISGFGDYFVEPDGSIGFESTLFHSKNRAGNRKPRLQLFMVVEGYSRVAYALFYMGKNVLNWIDFLVRSWSPKEEPYRFPFQGRPHHLYSDSEGIFRSPLMVRFLQAMDVEYGHHFPGNSRAKGKVERVIGEFKERMRHLLQIELYEKKNPISLTRANDLLDDFLFRRNTRPHSRTRQEPLARWRAGFSKERGIRLMPDPSVTDRFFYTMQTRQLQGDLTLQIQGLKWQLPRKEPFISRTGQTLQVFYHPGDLELKSIYVVIDDVEYEITHATPVPDKAGQYRKVAQSEYEKRLEKLAEVDLSQVQVDGYREAYTDKSFLPTQGEALDVEELALPRRAIARLQLIPRLQGDGIIGTPPTAQERAYIDTLYRDGAEVYEDQLDQIIEDLQGPSGALRAFG